MHLDGLKDHHDKAVSQEGVFDRAVSAIKAAKAKGFTVNVNATIFDGHAAEDIAKFLDFTTELGVGVSMSPGYAYERAPDQEHFLNRTKTKKLFRDVFALGKGKKWNFMHSGLFLDFLAGNQNYECTPWGMPARNIFGWQKPCYLLGEGYTKTFKELMETTDWETYGTGKYEKCADCMAHCGYEPTAAEAALTIRSRRCGWRCAACGRRGRWRPRSTSRTSGRRSTSSRRKCRSACQRSAATRPSPPSRKPRQPRRLFSARLKSIPVETSARSVSGLRATPAQHLAQIDIAIRLDRGHRQRRQSPAWRGR